MLKELAVLQKFCEFSFSDFKQICPFYTLHPSGIQTHDPFGHFSFQFLDINGRLKATLDPVPSDWCHCAMVVYGRAELENSKLYVDGIFISDLTHASDEAYGPFRNVTVIGGSVCCELWQKINSKMLLFCH